MLQYIISKSDQYTAVQQAKIALAAGCAWIELRKHSTDDYRSAAKEIAMLCKEHEAMFLIDNDVVLLEELKCHGMMIGTTTKSHVFSLRERVGGEPIIGVMCKTAEEIVALAGADIDYVQVDLSAESDAPHRYSELINAVREQGINFYIVAAGQFSTDQLKPLIEAGCAGVALYETDLENLTTTIENAIATLDSTLE